MSYKIKPLNWEIEQRSSGEIHTSEVMGILFEIKHRTGEKPVLTIKSLGADRFEFPETLEAAKELAEGINKAMISHFVESMYNNLAKEYSIP